MIELATKLGFSACVLEKLSVLILQKGEKIDECAERCISSGFHHLKTKAPLFRLAVILNLACRVKKKYDMAGIDEKIYYDTMSDIKIWSDKCREGGLENYGWLKNHVSFELFRLGRLQFQLYECKNKTLLYNKLPFTYGDRLIYVHIPEGEKLSAEKCEDSFCRAKDFFGRYFPGYKYEYYFCESWLLFEGNVEFMSYDCNIVRFMSFFDICYSVKIDEQAVERIFGKRELFKKNYPEKTSLQKSAKQYMLSGGRMGIGVGIRKLK